VAIGLAGKKAIVKEVNDVASNALAVTVAEYRGIEVADMTALRKKAREQGIFVKVVRNTLAKRAFEGTQFDDMGDALKGLLFMGFLWTHRALQLACSKTSQKKTRTCK
jgi:LSU ribosomal protein L10P